MLASALGLTACSSARPIVASERKTTDDLLASLRGAGLCADPVTFRTPPDVVLDEVYGVCEEDGLAITFFPPADSGGITVVFPPRQCSHEVDEEPMVIGINWTIVAEPGAAEDALDKASSATKGNLTTTAAAVADFCEFFYNG